MTPSEFKKLRKELRLSARGMAELLGLKDERKEGRTIRRYEAGDRAIPGPVARLVRLFAEKERILKARLGPRS